MTTIFLKWPISVRIVDMRRIGALVIGAYALALGVLVGMATSLPR